MSTLNLITVLLIATAVSTATACGSGWTKHGNKCYRLVDGAIGTLSDADRNCAQSRGRILTIQSQEEQTFLEDFLFKQLKLEENVWIGGQRQNLHFAWRNDGILIDDRIYSNWAEGKPSHMFAKACLQINSAVNVNSGKWSDNFCFAMNAIVCEKFTRPGVPEDDDSNNDDSNEDDNGNGQCCSQYKQDLSRMREEFERRFGKLEAEVNRRDDEIEQLKERLNHVVRDFDDVKQIVNNFDVDMTVKIQSVVNLDEIHYNFTAIANVLSHYKQEIRDLSERINQNHNNDNNGNVNVNDIKRELEHYLDQKLDNVNFKNVVTDAKLSYVNYRRALMIEKNGRWIKLGYV